MEHPNNSLSERIAHLVLDTFESLPTRCKPRQLPNGSREWTPLSSVVIVKHSIDPPKLKVLSLGTGTKSLPVSVLSKCQGLILHDCHAEILALRGFNYWLLCEMERIISQNDCNSPWLDRQNSNESQANSNPKGTYAKFFRIREDVEIYLFSTEAPCGDASMELLIAAARASGADTSPWPSPQVPSSSKLSTDHSGLPPGRGGFADLGALRRKPARADAEVSMSMSCTDKLAMKQFTTLVGYPVDILIEQNQQAYLKSMIVYEDQYDITGYKRAFARDGRLAGVGNTAEKSTSIQPRYFEVDVLPKDFRRFTYERLRSTSEHNSKSKVTNISTVWIVGSNKDSDVVEVLVNGVKQGYKQFDQKVKKGSVLCRSNMVQKALAVRSTLEQYALSTTILEFSGGKKYSELKNLPYRHDRKATKAWLLDKMGGWPKAAGDDFNISLEAFNQNTILSYVLS